MARIIAPTRAWLRKAWKKQENIDATASGPRISLPLSISDEPQETRAGSNESGKEPFYEMDAKRLWGYYHGYRSSYEHRSDILYADTIAFQLAEMHPILENSIKVKDVEITLLAVPFRLPPKLKQHGDAAVSFGRF